jgi:two-component sensor histidine kinase
VDQTRTIMLAIAGFLLAAALAASSRAQQRTIEVGEALRQHSERALSDREFLLQEMKHRIKNMIARVLAMSRQTARSADSLSDFTDSFSARLQAMAASQDLLARTSWQSADLQTLLVQELRQLFGQDFNESQASGPRHQAQRSCGAGLRSCLPRTRHQRAQIWLCTVRRRRA